MCENHETSLEPVEILSRHQNVLAIASRRSFDGESKATVPNIKKEFCSYTPFDMAPHFANAYR
ncbi:MAG: hypothetical protein GXP27_07890 [Planctomycetes bacterium]|nr:hypothetical protein [Planctomycetota bacterium]